MKLWMSGEIQADIADIYRETRKSVEAEVNRLLSGISLPGTAEKWAVIAIIRAEDYPDYDEIVKKSSGGKVLEFRLKIPHAEFLLASPRQRTRLLFEVLLRSVERMRELGISADTRHVLRALLFRAKDHDGSAGLIN